MVAVAEWIDIGLPPMGEGSVDDIVSHTAPVYRAIYTVANEMHDTAALQLNTGSRKRTGDAQIKAKHSRFHGGPTDLDSYVYLQDPNNSRAAFSIENGHWTGSRKKALGDAEGPLTREQAGTWVPGLHPIGKAVAKAVSRGRSRALFR